MNTPLSPHRLAEFGRVIAEPARAAILLVLMDGSARPAGELARIADVGAATASAHLRVLCDAGLLFVRAQGRHRYYGLASEDIAQLVETLALAMPQGQARTPLAHVDADIARARTCYRHLAGRVGVALFDRLSGSGGMLFTCDAVRLSTAGIALLRESGLVTAHDEALLPLRGRTCLDWTERRLHLSGALGTHLMQRLLERGWLQRREDSRALRISARGRAGLRALGIDVAV